MLLVLLFDLSNLERIVCKKNSVLLIQTIFKIFAMENGFKLPKKFERILNVADNLKVFVDVGLKRGLNGANVNVELNKIAVKCIVVEIKKLVVLLFEHVDVVLEAYQNRGNVL